MTLRDRVHIEATGILLSGGSVALFGNLHPEPGALGWKPLAGQSASRFEMLRDACKNPWNPWRQLLRLPHCSCAAPNTSRRSFPHSRGEQLRSPAPQRNHKAARPWAVHAFTFSPNPGVTTLLSVCRSGRAWQQARRIFDKASVVRTFVWQYVITIRAQIRGHGSTAVGLIVLRVRVKWRCSSFQSLTL